MQRASPPPVGSDARPCQGIRLVLKTGTCCVTNALWFGAQIKDPKFWEAEGQSLPWGKHMARHSLGRLPGGGRRGTEDSGCSQGRGVIGGAKGGSLGVELTMGDGPMAGGGS